MEQAEIIDTFGTYQPTIMLKLDISKAFDTVCWPFLLEVLQHMGFGPRWIRLICGLLHSSSTSILVNGRPGEMIKKPASIETGGPPFATVILVLEAIQICCGSELPPASSKGCPITKDLNFR